MTMAFKYQVSLALRPKDILLITLNHMDAIRTYVEGSTSVRAQVDHVYKMLIDVSVRLLQCLIYCVSKCVTKNKSGNCLKHTNRDIDSYSRTRTIPVLRVV